MALSFAEKQDYYLKTYRELKVKYPNYRFSAPAAPENFDFTIELNPSAKPENTDYAALHYSLERNAMKLRLEGIINVDKNKPSLTKANRVQLTTNLNTKWNSKTIYFGNKVSRMQLDLTSVQFPDDNSEAIHQLDMLLNHFIAAMEETIAELEKLENTFETAREIPVQIKRTESYQDQRQCRCKRRDGTYMGKNRRNLYRYCSAADRFCRKWWKSNESHNHDNKNRWYGNGIQSVFNRNERNQ